MFKRVLIAEDHESVSISVKKTLTELEVAHIVYVYYCDDALIRIEKAMKQGEPYDLLITDLSFEEDHRLQQILTGNALVKAVKKIQPNIKTLIFSAENKPAVIDELFSNLKVDGYVRKARNDAKELKVALTAIYKGRKYLPDGIKQSIKEKNTYEFSSFEIIIISLLSNGTLQKDIPTYLQQHQIKPSGLSSVEKRLNLMKESLGFAKNEQLVAFCKDMGII